MYGKLSFPRFFWHLAIFGIFFGCRLMSFFLTQFWTEKLLIHNLTPCRILPLLLSILLRGHDGATGCPGCSLHRDSDSPPRNLRQLGVCCPVLCQARAGLCGSSSSYSRVQGGWVMLQLFLISRGPYYDLHLGFYFHVCFDFDVVYHDCILR